MVLHSNHVKIHHPGESLPNWRVNSQSPCVWFPSFLSMKSVHCCAIAMLIVWKWNDGWTLQAGSTWQMSAYWFRDYPTGQCGPGPRSLLWCSSMINEGTCSPSCQDLFFHLLCSTWCNLGCEVTARLVSAFIISRLDNCNYVLARLPTLSLIEFLYKN